MAKAKKEEKPKSKVVMVKAVKRYFDGAKVREIGEVFPFDLKGADIEESESLVLADDVDAKAVAKKHKELAEAGAEHDSEFSQNDANAKAAQKHKEPDIV